MWVGVALVGDWYSFVIAVRCWHLVARSDNYEWDDQISSQRQQEPCYITDKVVFLIKQLVFRMLVGEKEDQVEQDSYYHIEGVIIPLYDSNDDQSKQGRKVE